MVCVWFMWDKLSSLLSVFNLLLKKKEQKKKNKGRLQNLQQHYHVKVSAHGCMLFVTQSVLNHFDWNYPSVLGSIYANKFMLNIYNLYSGVFNCGSEVKLFRISWSVRNWNASFEIRKKNLSNSEPSIQDGRFVHQHWSIFRSVLMHKLCSNCVMKLASPTIFCTFYLIH